MAEASPSAVVWAVVDGQRPCQPVRGAGLGPRDVLFIAC